MVLRMILIYLISRNDLLIDPKSSTKAALLICFYLILHVSDSTRYDLLIYPVPSTKALDVI